MTAVARYGFAAWLALLVGCGGWCGRHEPPMAELVAARGDVSAARAAAPMSFSGIEVGAIFELGDAIRTGREATARVALDDGSTLDVRPGTTIRFSPTRPDARTPRFDVLAGEASLTAAGETTVETRGGRARLGAGTRVTLRATTDGDLELVVVVGRARLEMGGEVTELAPGTSAAIDPRGTVRVAPRSDPPPVAGGAAAAPSPGPLPDAVRATTTGVHHVQLAGAEGWQDLAAGDHPLPAGTRVRQEAGASMSLARGDATVSVRGGAEFVVGEGRTLVRLISGTPEVASSSDGVSITTASGVLVTRPSGGRASATFSRDDAGALSVEVREGAFDVQRDEGTVRVAAGESVTLGPAGPGPGEGAPSLLADRVDLAIGLGDSVVVRDLHPPTALGFDISRACPSGGEMTVFGDGGSTVLGAARGDGTLRVFFDESAQRYELRCLADGAPAAAVAARGRVRVLRSSGQAPLPRSAPESTVEADGRTYNIVYQNQPPAITAHWPGGPPGPAVLVLGAGAGARRIDTAGPRHRLSPRALREGTSSLHFESPGTGRRSRDTTVVLRFDPAAASASVVEPADGSFAPGASVTVSGTALPGWTVRAGDRELPVGTDQRFSGSVTVPASGVLIVRLARSGQGVHYYVRRASSPTP